jgi:tRNA nucleotidyltransferase (CCA-adding enzyme)
MNSQVLRLCEAVRKAGGRAMLVGGSVRDQLLGIQSKDFDVEVYQLNPARLRQVLELIGRVSTVGDKFSVYKLVFTSAETIETDEEARVRERFEIDVSLPRRESKSGRGHRGFVIEGDPTMSFEEAARRRDFTINAILLDPLTGERIDPYGGQDDLNRRVLKAVAVDTFVEDSLRVLRAVQLAARFQMTVDPDTIRLCRTIDLSDLPRERIWGEIEKLLVLAPQPSIGLDAALELGVLEKLFPEIRALVGIASDRVYAEYDDAFKHTKDSLDIAANLSDDLSKPHRIAVMLATLCHDLRASSNEASSVRDSLKITSEVVEATQSVLNRLGVFGINGYDVRSQVLALVREHLNPREYYSARETITDGDFRRLAQRVDIDLLYRVSKSCADAGSDGGTAAAEQWFIDHARSLGVEHGPPAPLLQGRDLIEAGYEPGPEMGRLLRQAYELQLDGKVVTVEEALAAIRPDRS